MKNIILIICILAYCNCNAQYSNFFNYYADSVHGINSCNTILELDDSTIVFYNRYKDFNGASVDVFSLTFVEANGNVLTNKNNNLKIVCPLRKTLTNGFAALGQSLCPGAIKLTLLVFDHNGDTLWTRCYPSAQYNWGPMGSVFNVTRDSGFIVAGYQQIVKFDKYGNVQWVAPSYYIPLDITETIEGNFVVCGMGDPFKVTLYDSAGGLLWMRQHGTLYNPWTDYGATSVIQLADSNYLVSCMNDTPGYMGVGWNLMKLDKNNGDTLQTYLFSPFTNMLDWQAYLMHLSDSTIFWGLSFYFQHFDKYMNLLGSYWNFPPGWSGTIYDIKPTHDRGIIGSGYEIKNNINNVISVAL